MEPLPASQDALRLELRLAAGARNDADADGDGLSSSSYSSYISLSYTLVHRCRPRAVVDLFLLLLLLLIILLRFPLSLFLWETCSHSRHSKLLARMTRETKFFVRIPSKDRDSVIFSRENIYEKSNENESVGNCNDTFESSIKFDR